MTVKNKYPLPRRDDLFDQLQGATIFSKIDMRFGYHHPRIKDSNIPKASFQSRFGHFEFMVMPFGLASAPAVFMQLTNRVFIEFLDEFVVVFIDDILISSHTPEEHAENLYIMLSALRKDQIYAKFSKCEWWIREVAFLGSCHFSRRGSGRTQKIEDVIAWEVPKYVKDVQDIEDFWSAFPR